MPRIVPFAPGGLNRGPDGSLGSPEQFVDRLQQEYGGIAAVIREAGVKPEF
jgi:hypothetical protein